MAAFTVGYILKSVVLENVIKYWKPMLVFGILGYVYYLQEMKIPWLKEDIADLEAANSLCEMSRTDLKDSIEMVNTQIGEWQNLTGKLQAKNDDLAGELISMREKKQEIVTNILDVPTPKTCEKSMDFLRDIEVLQW